MPKLQCDRVLLAEIQALARGIERMLHDKRCILIDLAEEGTLLGALKAVEGGLLGDLEKQADPAEFMLWYHRAEGLCERLNRT